jgi:hypothetical protein
MEGSLRRPDRLAILGRGREDLHRGFPAALTVEEVPDQRQLLRLKGDQKVPELARGKIVL